MPSTHRLTPGLKAAVFVLLAAASTGGAGCAAVPLATAGTLAGIAATGVDTGSGLYKLGKLDSTHLAGFADVVEAVHVVAEETRVALKDRSTRDAGWLRLTFVDDRGADLVITIERRTETLTRSRIDVGIFGSETTARLFQRQMRAHLPPVSGQPARRPTGDHAADVSDVE